jgi:putative membrane protein
MRWLKRHLNQADRQRIENAVRESELKTSGEIIPVVARRSARYGHVPWLAGALVFAAFKGSGLGFGLLLAWGRPPWLGLGLDVLGAALAGRLLALLPWVRRILTPQPDQAAAVHRAAEAAFLRLGLYRARGDAGVLLFVSLEERRAVVLAGAGIADLAGPEHWDRTCAALTSSARRKDLAEGFVQAVGLAAGVMAKHHPPAAETAAPVLRQRLHILHGEF